jgi:F420-dependent oxidoreductase-like protein
MAGSLQVGLMVEGQEGVSWPQWQDLAAAAEEHGFSGLYRSDHYLSERIGSNRDSLDAWGTICALSPVTSRIRLGTLVSPAGFRHPSVLAKLVATADQVSGGRVELGMGIGWFEEEHLAYGFDFGAPRARMDMLEEQVEIIKRSWGAGPFSFSGEHYRLADLDAWPKPVQQPAPRLILGGNGGPRSIALAARWADEYNSSDPTNDQIRERRAALTAECERIGRDPATVEFSIVTGVLVGTDRSELEERALRTARFFGDEPSDPTASLEGLPEPWLVGTPAEIVERLRVLESLGVDRIMLWAPLHDDLGMIALIGSEILPAVRAG